MRFQVQGVWVLRFGGIAPGRGSFKHVLTGDKLGTASAQEG